MSDKLSDRWAKWEKEKAHTIVNDIAEDIDNHETRAQLRQALAIYADLLYDEREKKAIESNTKLIEAMGKLADVMEKMNK